MKKIIKKNLKNLVKKVCFTKPQPNFKGVPEPQGRDYTGSVSFKMGLRNGQNASVQGS